jgi:hypothetical protein
MKPKPPVTTPAHKYGPTDLYGDCEAGSCETNARETCSVCGGHFCLRHIDHTAHNPEAESQGA